MLDRGRALGTTGNVASGHAPPDVGVRPLGSVVLPPLDERVRLRQPDMRRVVPDIAERLPGLRLLTGRDVWVVPVGDQRFSEGTPTRMYTSGAPNIDEHERLLLEGGTSARDVGHGRPSRQAVHTRERA